MLTLTLLAAFAPQCTAPPEDRIFNKIRDTMPYSLPNALAVSPDGRWIYCGEGGAMAYLDTHDPDGYLISAPREPISKYGARPAAILLDEGPLTGTDDDLLVVAAGRSGLWVMDAHPADDV